MKVLPDTGQESHLLSYQLLFGATQQTGTGAVSPDSLHDLNVNRAGQYLLLNHILLCLAITCWVNWLSFVNLWNIFRILLYKYLPLYTHRGMCYFLLWEFSQIRKNACSKQGQQRLCRKTTLGVATKHTQECWETSAAPLWAATTHALLQLFLLPRGYLGSKSPDAPFLWLSSSVLNATNLKWAAWLRHC